MIGLLGRRLRSLLRLHRLPRGARRCRGLPRFQGGPAGLPACQLPLDFGQAAVELLLR